MGREAAAGPARRRLIRRPAAAGTFYPADRAALAAAVDGLLAGSPAPEEPPAAIVVPHAGYAYSGPVAASAYRRVAGAALRRVALLGPAHFVSLRGLAAPAAETWSTPLGDVPVDAELRAAAVGAGARADDVPHAPEHALEVQLPFLARASVAEPAILPLAVGVASPHEVADVIDAVWDLVDLVVVSTDLSHYLDDVTARRVDRRTAQQVLAREAASIPDAAACGIRSLRGVVEFARRRDLRVRLLDLGTSADATGDPSRVVGYGAFEIG
jgi:hypothetical protein